MSFVAHQEGGFSLLYLFGVVSGLFQLLLASYGLLRVVLFFTSNDVTKCFDLQIYYESTGRVIDFGNLLLSSPNTLPLGILEKLKSCYNQKKE